MESIFQHGNRKKKGLTLIETVVALTITVIISIAVVSLSIYASNAIYTQRAQDFFIHETTNIATIYESYNEVNYVKAFKSHTGVEVSGYQNVTLYYHDDFTYSSSDDYAYYLNVTFETETLKLSSYNVKDTYIYGRSIAR